jgi:hypothetical protein
MKMGPLLCLHTHEDFLAAAFFSRGQPEPDFDLLARELTQNRFLC